MNRGDPVGAVRTNNRQVGHPDLAIGALFYQADALNPSLVTGEPAADGIQEALQPNQSEIDASAIKFPDLAQLNQVRQLSAAELRDRIASSNLQTMPVSLYKLFSERLAFSENISLPHPKGAFSGWLQIRVTGHTLVTVGSTSA